MKTIRVLLLVSLVLLALPVSVSAFYNPSAGRWLSRYPIGEYQGPNVYGAMLNDGLSLIDRDGRAVSGTTPPAQPQPALPNIEPCTWESPAWEHKMSPKQTSSTWGWTDFKVDPDFVKKMLTYKGCDGLAPGCMDGEAIKANCTMKIWIHRDVPLDRPTVTTTVWKHESKHASESASNHKNQIDALNTARNWCLPGDCHKIRKDYLSDIYQIYESYRAYLSNTWDAKDNPFPENRKDYQVKANSDKTSIGSMLSTAAKHQRDLQSCLQKHGMTIPNSWPKLPKL